MAPDLVKKIADAPHPPRSLNPKKPRFEKEKVTVIFVLGGPGAGVSFLSLLHYRCGIAMSLH
jgi:hypothetical protein